MAESSVFTVTCSELDRKTSLSEIESRGTVRLALKAAGLEAVSITTQQMNVVLERVLPRELSLRGVDDAENVCRDLQISIRDLMVENSESETPDAVFARLGSSRNRPA